MKPAVVDLFCGAGGLSYGFVKERFEVKAGVDIDATCKFPYEANTRAVFVNKPIEKVTPQEIEKYYDGADIKVLVGCAPCQPFSSYNKEKCNDEKWKLLYVFLDLVSATKPDIVSMENVPQLVRHQVFKDFIRNLQENGYCVSWYIVYCPDYGVPQTRRRLVLFASKFGNVGLIRKTYSKENYRTVRDVIGDLEPINDGETSRKDPLHRASKLSETNKKRIMNTPPGGSWKDWPDELKLKCHKKKTGRSFKGVYGRMRWDAPAPTITTQCVGLGNGRFGHPEQDRAISLREAALIQTFPKGYKFVENKHEFYVDRTARHIGNAVPVKLGQVIAKSIKKHLETIQNDG
jgi:DNA (cytosine-5)-methyltransferase 1